MRSYLPLIALIVITGAACSGKTNVPADILAPAVMQDLVWDVMVVDEYSKDVIASDTIRNKNLKKERSIAYQQVFTLYKTNREDYIKSFNYYTEHPDLTKALFDTLAVRANNKREEAFRIRLPKKAIVR
jgi:excinuclease UvrABC ATPase subunit